MNKHVKKFIFTSVITTVVALIVSGVAWGVYAMITSLSTPPTIPAQVVITRQGYSGGLTPADGTSDGTADGVTVPSDGDSQKIGVMDRKELFYTFLLFGIDNSNNADVIIVGAVDIPSHDVFLVSVPRDTLVDVPRRLRKPVGAYSAGRVGGGGHEGGVEQMYSDVQSLFGFRPDFYISVQTQAFVRIVDAVGGVKVNVPFPMRYDDPFDNLHINIPAGEQTLSGEKALHFARYRQANEGYRAVTDYERIKNQQQILRSIFDELLTPQTITRVPELINIYADHVRTNMELAEMLWFAGQLSDLREGTFSAYTIPTGETIRAGWYEVVDAEALLELINSTVNPFEQEITMDMVRIINE
ncbi:MAG: LCP family protein [Defluviitaleaceae bacterium]|nr:LCP family protein [Defluviitaleaceae bacterium]